MKTILTLKYGDKYTGTDSFASSISFFGNKTLTSGEGGAFITNDCDVFEYINKIKSQGQSNEKFVLEKKATNRLPYVFNLKAIKK